MVTVRPAREADMPRLMQMRAVLWPDASFDDPRLADVSTLPSTVFVAEAPDGNLIGFVDTGLRSHADGCDPAQPVGFVEGWFVEEAWRGKGVGRQLIAAAEEWARSHGCREMASDTWIDQEISQRAHEALGYEVVDRCVHYRKDL